jgi:hypothetical protein
MTTRLLTTPKGDVIDVTLRAPTLALRSTYFASLFTGSFSEAIKVQSGESLAISIPTLDGTDAHCWNRFLDIVVGARPHDYCGVLLFWQALCYIDLDRHCIEEMLSAVSAKVGLLCTNDKTPSPHVDPKSAYFVLALCDVLALDDDHPYAMLLPLLDDDALDVSSERVPVTILIKWSALKEAADALQSQRNRGRVPMPHTGRATIYHTAALLMGSICRSFANLDYGETFIDVADLPAALVARCDIDPDGLRGSPQSQEPLVVAADAFERRLATRYPVFGPFIGALTAIDGVVLAGGAFMRCLDAKTHDRPESEPANGGTNVKPSDIDLWVYGDTADMRAQTLAQAATAAFACYPGRVEATFKGAAVTFSVDGGTRPKERLQIVVTPYASPTAIVDAFDNTHVHGFYDGARTIVSWRMLWTLASRYTEPIGALCTCENVERVRKAQREGLGVVCHCAWKFDPAARNLSSWRQAMGFVASADQSKISRGLGGYGRLCHTSCHLYDNQSACAYFPPKYHARCVIGVLVLAVIDSNDLRKFDCYTKTRWLQGDTIYGVVCPRQGCCSGPPNPQEPPGAKDVQRNSDDGTTYPHDVADKPTVLHDEASAPELHSTMHPGIAWMVRLASGHVIAGGHRGERAARGADPTWSHLSARSAKKAHDFASALKHIK